MRSSISNHRFLLMTCIAYAFVSLLLCAIYHVSPFRLLSCFTFLTIPVFFYFPVMYGLCFFQSLFNNRKNLSFSIIKKADNRWDEFARSQPFREGLVGLFAITLFINFFCVAKSLFTLIASVQLDTTFAEWDRILHGTYPHEYFLPFVSAENMHMPFQGIYLFWFFVMFVASLYSLFYDKNFLRRKQYLWSYILSWIFLGTFGAILFYSAGPIFYHLVNPSLPDPYAPLLNWMTKAENGEPIFFYKSGMLLYDAAMDDKRPDVNGPSAMPSMHVAVSWLITLYAYKIKKPLGIFMGLFTVGILISSIILGWHYAVDGYAGIIGVGIIWLITGYLLKRHETAKACT